MGTATDNTAPPTPNTPPAPTIAQLYGPSGGLVVAPPTTPAGMNQDINLQTGAGAEQHAQKQAKASLPKMQEDYEKVQSDADAANAADEQLYQTNPEEYKKQSPFKYVARKAHEAAINALSEPALRGMSPEMRAKVEPKVRDFVETAAGLYQVIPSPKQETGLYASTLPGENIEVPGEEPIDLAPAGGEKVGERRGPQQLGRTPGTRIKQTMDTTMDYLRERERAQAAQPTSVENPLTPGEYVYHAADISRAPSIRENGLRPKSWYANSPEEALRSGAVPVSGNKADLRVFAVPKSEIEPVAPDAADMGAREVEKGRFTMSAKGHQPIEVTQDGRPLSPLPVSLESVGGKSVDRGNSEAVTPAAAANLSVNPFDASTTFYHGTKAPISSADQTAPNTFAQANGLMGLGTYVTDNPEVASGYATTKGRGAGRVLGAKIPAGNYLDADIPASPKIREIFNRAAPNDTGELEGKTIRDLFQNLRERYQDEGWSQNDATDALQQLTIDLRQEGYNGFRYEGGKTKAGQKYGPHNVAVVFPDYEGRPNDLTPVTPAKSPVAVSGRVATPAEGEKLLTSERQSALKQPYTITVKNEDGTQRIEMIDAFSSKDALKQAQQKFPEGGEWQAISAPGKSEASTEYSVPKGKLLSMPDGGDGKTPIQSMRHELGHALVGQNEGLTQEGMQRHTHPDVPSGVKLGVRWDASDVFDRTTGQVKAEKLTPLIRTFMGGVAADEVFNDTPRAANHNFMDMGHPEGDGGQAYKFLRAAGYDHDGAVDFMHTAIDDAKAHLQKPAVSDIIKENEGVREPNLSKQYHYSAERLSQMHAEAQRRLGNEVNESGTNNAEGNAAGKPDVASGQGETAPANEQGPAKKVTTHEVNPEEEGDESFNFGANEKSPTADIPESKRTDTLPEQIVEAHNANGGSTFNPTQGNLAGTDNYAVSAFPQRGELVKGDLTPNHVQNFMDKNQDLLADSKNSVGTWKNENGNHALDIVHTTPDRDAAIKMGQENNQKAIYHLKTGETIDTGGTGGVAYKPKETNAELQAKTEKGIPLSDTKGFEHLSKDFYAHMEPDEREYLKGNKLLQRNAMKQYYKITPSVEETTNAMAAGAALGGWWQRYMDVFHDLTGAQAQEAADHIGPAHSEVLKQWHAAVSGNKSVEDANNLAWHSYADWLDAGKPTDRTSINNIVKQNAAQPEGSPKKGNAAISDTLDKNGKILSEGLDTSKLFKLVNSPEMRGERPFSNEAFNEKTPNALVAKTEGARKIPSMGATVAGKGNLNRLVIDAHIRDFYGRTNSGGPAAQYIADSVHLRQAAEALGLKGGEGQEQLWGTVLGLKQLLKTGLTPEEAAGKLNSDVINQIGKDYAEVIANDPEITKPGGLLDRLKEKYGVGSGSAGVGEANRKASASRASQAESRSSQTPVNQTQLAKTAERIKGQISESKIKKPAVAVPAEEAPVSKEAAPASIVEDKYTAALKAGDAAAKAKRAANMKKGISGLSKPPQK